VVLPLDALTTMTAIVGRRGYQQRAVERLLERVEALGEAEREAFRFMLGQERLVSVGDLSKALSGYVGGAAQVRWGTAQKNLLKAGLIDTVERQGSRPRVREWVESELAPHGPDVEEIEAVWRAVLGRIAGEAVLV